MEAIASRPLHTHLEHTTANRSRMYAVIAEIFRYPDTDFRRQAKTGDLEQALQHLSRNLPYPFVWTAAETASLRAVSGVSEEDIEVEFIRLFEAGPGQPPLPLLEGLFREDRQAIFKELILFYNHFGLSYAEGSMEDRPDHLCYQMEFLHFLVFKELKALQAERDNAAYLRAQQDFLERHPLLWIGLLLEKVREMGQKLPPPAEACLEVFHFYGALLSVVHRFLMLERECREGRNGLE